jgi:phage terminase large subunit GpA-like protein
MKCPHCAESFHEQWSSMQLVQHRDTMNLWYATWLLCPACQQIVVRLQERSSSEHSIVYFDRLLWPQASARRPPSEVDSVYTSDYLEAVATLPVSPKASAALSRRLLQAILRDRAEPDHPRHRLS